MQGTARMDNGWRISLALAGVPAILLIIGGIMLPGMHRSKVHFDL